MIIDITRLKSGIDEEIEINEKLEFTEESLKGTELIELNDVLITGGIIKDSIDDYIINISIDGIMVLPCSLTLKPVSYPFYTEISGNIEDLFKEMDEIDRKIENTIDILPIIWENILMEIPIRVLSDKTDDIKLEGNGWKFVTEEENNECNPELQKLKDLLNEK